MSVFAITKDGDLISVFNASGKKGFLRSIAPFIKENAKTLYCYVLDGEISKTNLKDIYKDAFGFEVSNEEDYNWDYDHDEIGKRYNEMKVETYIFDEIKEIVNNIHINGEYVQENAQKSLTSENDNDNLNLKDKDISSVYEERNKLSERSSNDLRRIQEEGIRNLERAGWGVLGKEFDDELRRRLSNVLKQELGARVHSNGNGTQLLENTGEFKIIENVDGDLFHDIFSTARVFLPKGELVDIHPIETNEDWTGYKDCKNYLNEDGLCGFSMIIFLMC